MCPAFEKICEKCSKKGHIKLACRMSEGSGVKSINSKSEVVGQSGNESAEEENDDGVTGKVSAVTVLDGDEGDDGGGDGDMDEFLDGPSSDTWEDPFAEDDPSMPGPPDSPPRGPPPAPGGNRNQI